MTQTMQELGIRRGMPFSEYVALDAIGSTHLDWLAVSPLHYRYMSEQEPQETDAMRLGTALHTLLLEPEAFEGRYTFEPELASIAPDAKSPRATKAYKEWRAGVEAAGGTVMRQDDHDKVMAMAASVTAHTHARRAIEQAREREVTLLWGREGKLCRGRVDMLAGSFLGDLKTTNDLARFSPFKVTDLRYYGQAAWYRDGLWSITGEEPGPFLFVAVESAPPFDVGVFTLGPDAMELGRIENARLFDMLLDCERTNRWPGMFPEVQTATVTDRTAERIANAEGDL